MDHQNNPRPTGNRLSGAPSAPPPGEAMYESRDSEFALEEIVTADDLSVVFQPIVEVDTVVPFAYEALVRCRIPRFSRPPDLLEHAMQTHCVGRLGRMIREIALPLCVEYPLFVNIHPQELNESWLVRPDDPIFSHEQELYLEVTESVPLTHHKLCMTVLNEVRSRGGIQLVVDDLGAGYSNLKHIADLEPVIVKIDRNLIVGVETHPRQRVLIHNVVELCHDLGARVVAEGIETRLEYEIVRDAGVDLVQGYLFGRPSFPISAQATPRELLRSDLSLPSERSMKAVRRPDSVPPP